MKKRNLILLVLICILSLFVFIGLLVYAFQLQHESDLKDGASGQNTQSDLNSSETANPSVAATAIPTEAADESNSETSNQNASVQLTPDASFTVTPTPAAGSLDQTDTGSSDPIILGFAGDVNLDENYYPVKKYDSVDEDIQKCLSEDLLEEMNGADVMMLNNEFSYSTRGTKTPDKSFTFRADPSRVDILKKMGVDIVSLANNHALDYGPDALLDTFDTLDGAGIDYVGAGENLDRAKEPIYYTIGDKKIAFVAASRVVFAMDWYASDTGLGMIGTYDPALILESIKEAQANSDYVVMFVHWGIERENYPVDYQRNLAKMYIDAGADAVVGCHPHVMQGFEYYKGKPIAYSLGNYWFNQSTDKSGLLKLYLDKDGTVRMQILPAATADTFTYLLSKEADKKDYYDFMKEISFDVNIDADGFITDTSY
ncbi:MAG: CapA family protein [Herbinix sp.]|nr:CapA family protein [Herbinix sp.]